MTRADTLSLGGLLKEYSTPGCLCNDLGDDTLECYACGHRCVIKPGRDGICRVRFNEGGKLMVPSGYVGGLQIDPIEKKPFFHLLPGSRAISFGMLGCDYHCPYCQNWITSQAIRDPDARTTPDPVGPEELVTVAADHDARVITSTYNEPLITSEWAVEIFRHAKRSGLVTSYVSNGNGTPEVLEYLRPWVDAFKVDLKGFDDRRYRRLGGVLSHVLDTIGMLHDMNIWVEVVTLLVPDFNDGEGEIGEMARFLASVSPDIPWHVTAFHPDYKMEDTPATTVDSVTRAVRIGYDAGLRFVYAGNLPGLVDRFENTFCPSCHALVVERSGYRVLSNRIVGGRCSLCNYNIPGFWVQPSPRIPNEY
jgi:pyruvate formate lyase activating enzyme